MLIFSSCPASKKLSTRSLSDFSQVDDYKAREVEYRVTHGELAEAVDVMVAPPHANTECDASTAAPVPVVRSPASDVSANECDHSVYEDKEVLLIGDSHSYLRSESGNRMGNQVVKQVKACGAKGVEYHALCGSRPRSWINSSSPSSSCGVSTIDSSGFNTSSSGSTRNIIDLQSRQRPAVVIINLGDNMFSWRRESGKSVAYISSESSVASEVRSLIDTIDSSSECQWIGPVYHSPGSSYVKSNAAVDKLYRAITAGLGSRCTLIDSRGFFSSTRPNDGLHLTESESKTWGDEISREMRELR